MRWKKWKKTKIIKKRLFTKSCFLTSLVQKWKKYAYNKKWLFWKNEKNVNRINKKQFCLKKHFAEIMNVNGKRKTWFLNKIQKIKKCSFTCSIKLTFLFYPYIRYMEIKNTIYSRTLFYNILNLPKVHTFIFLNIIHQNYKFHAF